MPSHLASLVGQFSLLWNHLAQLEQPCHISQGTDDVVGKIYICRCIQLHIIIIYIYIYMCVYLCVCACVCIHMITIIYITTRTIKAGLWGSVSPSDLIKFEQGGSGLLEELLHCFLDTVQSVIHLSCTRISKASAHERIETDLKQTGVVCWVFNLQYHSEATPYASEPETLHEPSINWALQGNGIAKPETILPQTSKNFPMLLQPVNWPILATA